MDMHDCAKNMFIKLTILATPNKTIYWIVPYKLRNELIQLDLVNHKPQGGNRTIKYKKPFYTVLNQPFLVVSSSAFVYAL